jgi:Abi-like protein
MPKLALNYTNVYRSISHVRLSYYRTTSKTDEEALLAYLNNIRLSEALYPSLQQLEVLLRNQLEQIFQSQFGINWYVDSTFLSLLENYATIKIQEAIKELRKNSKTVASGAVVAELSFGFWTSFFGRNYEQTIWRPYAATLLPHAKPSERNITSIRSDLTRIRQLRNRIAHHEPICKNPRELAHRYKITLKFIRCISPDTALWLKRHKCDRFSEVYKRIYGVAP